GGRVTVGGGSDCDPGSGLGTELPGRERHRRPVQESPDRSRRRREAARQGHRGAAQGERGAAPDAPRRVRGGGPRSGRPLVGRPRGDPRVVPRLGRAPPREEGPPVVTLPGRRRIVALAVLLASIAGVLALLLLTDESAPASSGLSSARPVRATTALLPSAVLFWDTVTARVHLVADTTFVDPTSIRVSGSFAPYREVSTPVLERRPAPTPAELASTPHLPRLPGPRSPPH